MSYLSVIFIDVGWGDSILIEHEDQQGKKHYGLVDSNDSSESLSSYTFIKQHFEQKKVDYKRNAAFDFVMLTHWHTDHYSGLKRIIKKFGTHYFWYPKSWTNSMAVLLKYARHNRSRIKIHEAVNLDKIPPSFGDVNIKFHWPPYTEDEPYDEEPNNTSVVTELEYGNKRFLLTGDCLAKNWEKIIENTNKSRIKMFQAPHHGARNGMFYYQKTPWLDFLGRRTKIALSSHISPHEHPHEKVIEELNNKKRIHYRTDRHYNLVFKIENNKVLTKWSHFCTRTNWES